MKLISLPRIYWHWNMAWPLGGKSPFPINWQEHKRAVGGHRHRVTSFVAGDFRIIKLCHVTLEELLKTPTIMIDDIDVDTERLVCRARDFLSVAYKEGESLNSLQSMMLQYSLAECDDLFAVGDEHDYCWRLVVGKNMSVAKRVNNVCLSQFTPIFLIHYTFFFCNSIICSP